MQDIFISKIHIEKVRHLKDITIELSDTERKHLIITGKNGSGKTSLLEELSKVLDDRDGILRAAALNDPSGLSERRPAGFTWPNVAQHSLRISFLSSIRGTAHAPNDWVDKAQAQPDFRLALAYIPAKSGGLAVPYQLNPLDPIQQYRRAPIRENVNKEFPKYMMHLYVKYLSAKDQGGSSEAEQYKGWFDRLTQALRDIYDCPQLELKPDMDRLTFSIEMPEREPFGLDQMSDGYSAYLKILMELMMRMVGMNGMVSYERPAIVLIDEVEAHLHVELQKRALRFLSTMFPRAQFIAATHSPFVITSLHDAVVYDLEKRERLEDPSFYSYETVVESFLDASMYSDAMIGYFKRYKELCFKDRSPEEDKELLRAKAKLELMAPAQKELYIAFKEIEGKRKAGRNG